jgi:hypothetical protein
MYEYGILKPVKVILRRGRRKRDNNGENEPNRSAVHICGNVTMKPPVQITHANKNFFKKN